jgi:hypothetical protein
MFPSSMVGFKIALINKTPAAAMAGSRAFGNLNLDLKMQAQVTSARDACDSGDNKGDPA